MLYPDDLLYSTRHLWVDREEQGTAEVGITDDLQEELPEIISIDMPMVGDELEMDTECAHLHLPELYDVFSPLTGRAIEINRDVLDNPHLIHSNPYEAWLFRMEYDEPDEIEMLMGAERYMSYVDSL